MSSCHAHYGTAEFCDDCIDEKTAPLEADIADWKQWHRDLARVLRLDIVEKTVTYKSAARTKSERDDFSAQIATLTADLAAARADSERLDWLQAQTKGYGGWIGRDSTTGRGYRLHESELGIVGTTVREAIDTARRERGGAES